tara:strand:+ start:17 stop:2779 length:2763 start_codon:yes stop_codon:yes gene_type:complete
MATPTIPNGEEYFFPIIYEGNGAGQRVGKFVPFTDQATVANSVIFNYSNSAYLERTQDTVSGDDNKRKATFSCWFKTTGKRFGNETCLFGAAPSGRLFVRFDTSNRLVFRLTNSTTEYQIITNRTFEDTSKFYHLLWQIDASQGTAANRSRVWVDGDEITSWNSAAYPAQNTDIVGLADGTVFRISSLSHSATQFFDGYIAEFNCISGQALLPSSFGITDTSTGRWIPKTVEPFPTTTTDIAVTVVSSGGNKYALDGVTQGTVTLIEGATYKFDQSDSSNSGHPLRFSTTSDGTHNSGSEFSSGVTTAGTPGSSGAYTQITVPTGTATLYYYCSSHSGMGGTANTQDQYGTNGFRLKFQDASSLGDDTSGKGNDLSATNLATTDQTTDSPTQNSNTFGSISSGVTLSEGNLTVNSGSTGGYIQAVGQEGFGVSSGKWYWEVKVTTVGAAVYGWKDDGSPGGSQANDGSSASGGLSTGGAGSFSAGSWYIDLDYDNEVNYTTVSTNDVLMFAMDLDSGKGYCGKNGTWFNSANPANGTGAIGGCHRANGTNKFYPCVNRLDSASVGEFNFGQRSFAYTAPTGFLNLQQDNLPETDKGISSFVWAKNRDNGNRGFQLYDSSRGPLLTLYSNGDNAESTNADSLQKFLKGGFSAEDFTGLNESGESHVAWNWVANAGTTASNSNGSITSTVQANTTAGFSIVTYTGTGSNATVGHGLSSAPTWLMVKGRTNSVSGFTVGSATDPTGSGGFTRFFYLNETEASRATTSTWNNTAPTSSVFTVGTSTTVNASSVNFVALCWHDVEGFSRFGNYSGNGNANGPFIYTGFKPSWIMIKRTVDSGYHWCILDNKRNTFNPADNVLKPNLSDAEDDDANMAIDLLSNGFKIRGAGSDGDNINASGKTYVYFAFAENPFIGDGTNPVTAR